MLVLCSSRQSAISLLNSFTLHYMLLVVSRRNNMMLKLRNTILISMVMLVYKCNSEDFLPLFPCYSVHKIQADQRNSVHYYRFVGNSVLLSDDSGIGCMFTIEGPPGGKLQLQLFDVVLQRPGYVSTSLGDDNCSLGLVQIYNLTSNGALVQAQKVCGSFMVGPLIVSDTNVAVITTNAAQGQFDLHVTIPQQNFKSVFQANNIEDKTRVIFLGYEQGDLAEDLNTPTQKLAPQLFEKHLENTIKNVTSLPFKIKASDKENQMTETTEKAEEANKEDDSENYTEYDYEYEPDQHTLQEELSESEEKLPLEKLFILRENSKYENGDNFKISTNKRQKQFVHKTKHLGETISRLTPKPPKNATKTKGINQSSNKFRRV